MEFLGLPITGNSRFKVHMANHQKVKCLGFIQNLELEVFEVKACINFHIMPVGLGAFFIILGARIEVGHGKKGLECSPSLPSKMCIQKARKSTLI